MAKAKKKASKKNSQGNFSAVSMTGFGKSSAISAGIGLAVEIKSLNNRFLDLNLKLPKIYSEFEAEIRQSLSSRLSRGRVDVLVSRTIGPQASGNLVFHQAAFKTLIDIYSKVAKQEKVYDKQLHQSLVLNILSRRDVVEVESDLPLQKHEPKQLMAVINKALDSLVAMRKAEGKRLAGDLAARIINLGKILDELKDLASKSPEEIHERLVRRISALVEQLDIDQQRLATEVALLADKADITEELVRLESHLLEAILCLKDSGNGKKLEFITQELTREFNTIGSKSSDVNITSLVVEAKSQLEKIKEQSQNLE